MTGATKQVAAMADQAAWENQDVWGEDVADEHHLGQFIPLHYHLSMLMSESRMLGFKAAIDYTVFEGAKVLELGGGTGVLSCFAAAKADHVWCVEFNPDLVRESRRLLALNRHGDKVEVIHGDAFEYLPPEPVDVVICEMIHPAMLREKQVEVVEAFKQRYRRRFGDKLPVIIPEAVIMAVQPLQQEYDFFGFYAPIIQFQRGGGPHPGTTELAAPAVYSVLDFTGPVGREIQWEGTIGIEADGTVNALRFITKNILAVVPEQSSAIDWIVDHLVLPLREPVEVRAGDALKVAFSYMAGGSLRSLERSMSAVLMEN
jgi:protein arginine N-methyltransferase 1